MSALDRFSEILEARSRKTFTDFVKQTGKSYGNWRKSQQQNEEYVTEFQLPSLPSPGKMVRGGATSLLNPFSGPASDLVGGATGAVGAKLGGPVGDVIRKAAPVAGLGFGLTRAATPVGVAAAVFNQSTAAGRVKVGSDPKTKKPIYMDK